MLETTGKRIAALRQKYGWTQQSLADRLAISRVAVSHIEMDLTVPGERTVILLAGLFKITPLELVSGTTYPEAKAERLPPIACSYTALEVELALLDNDLKWLDRMHGITNLPQLSREIRERWSAKIASLKNDYFEEREREMIDSAFRKLTEACRRAE